MMQIFFDWIVPGILLVTLVQVVLVAFELTKR
jgi:hypothetical protein